MTRRSRALACAVLLAAGAMIGCSTYHRVTDRDTGAVYYTTNWDLHRYGTSDAVRFRDHTGQIHTLNNADVLEVTESVYTAETGN